MKRTIKKQFWFSRDEAQDLQKKAKKTCLSEAALVRLLLRGYEPKEKPDDRFYDAMREFSAIGNNIHQISVKANALGFIDTQKLNSELERLHKFQADVGTESVSWMCILGAAPFAALGFIKYNGMTAEKFVWAWFKSEFLMPKKLTFRSTNTYYEMMKSKMEHKQKEVLRAND